MNKNYEVLYKNLKKYVLTLRPYCNNCASRNTENGCDECNRKSFYWAMDKEIIESMEESENE